MIKLKVTFRVCVCFGSIESNHLPSEMFNPFTEKFTLLKLNTVLSEGKNDLHQNLFRFLMDHHQESCQCYSSPLTKEFNTSIQSVPKLMIEVINIRHTGTHSVNKGT